MEDERLDQTLRQQDGDALARERARDAKTVAQDGNGDHLVLRHFREELIVRGLLSLSTRGAPWSVISVTRIVAARVCRVQRAPSALGLEPHHHRSSTRIDANAHASTAKHIPVRRALGCWPSPSSYPWTISVDDKTHTKTVSVFALTRERILRHTHPIVVTTVVSIAHTSRVTRAMREKNTHQRIRPHRTHRIHTHVARARTSSPNETDRNRVRPDRPSRSRARPRRRRRVVVVVVVVASSSIAPWTSSYRRPWPWRPWRPSIRGLSAAS